jgi:hypothetical protein
MIAVAVMVTAVLASSSLLVSGFALLRVNRESGLALASARQTIESLQSGNPTFEDLFALFNADPADDPGGAGTASGSNFDVRGLNTRYSDPDGRPGRIEFPSPTASPGELREDLTADLFGLAANVDLNGDGAIDSLNHASDYSLLPVVVRVEWTGSSGNRSLALRTFFAKR